MENNSTPPILSSALLREGMHSIPNPLTSLKKGLVMVTRTVGALTALALAEAKEDDTWREQPSDDLVFAVALACWQLQRPQFTYEFI